MTWTFAGASQVQGEREADRNEAERVHGHRLPNRPRDCGRPPVGGGFLVQRTRCAGGCLPVSLCDPHTFGRWHHCHRGHIPSLSQTVSVTELSALPSFGKDLVLLVFCAHRLKDGAGRCPGTACTHSPGLSRRPWEPDAEGEDGRGAFQAGPAKPLSWAPREEAFLLLRLRREFEKQALGERHDSHVTWTSLSAPRRPHLAESGR